VSIRCVAATGKDTRRPSVDDGFAGNHIQLLLDDQLIWSQTAARLAVWVRIVRTPEA
jgi:hypothetical protein